jgi:hypothetical protein
MALKTKRNKVERKREVRRGSVQEAKNKREKENKTKRKGREHREEDGDK